MAIYREDILDIDLESGSVNKSGVCHLVAEGDANANRYGVRVLRNGQPVDLTGVGVSGYFVRANGTSVVLSGGRSGSVAYVVLNAGCYQVEGDFTLTIKLTYGGYTVTARMVQGTVVNAVAGDIVDTGSVVPDLASFSALVDRVETAAAKIEGFGISATQITGTRYRINVS